MPTFGRHGCVSMPSAYSLQSRLANSRLTSTGYVPGKSHGDSPSGPAGETNARRAQISKRLLERTQVDFLRPGRRSLPMDLPVSLGDGVNVEEPILAALLDRFRSPAAQTLTVDSPVDDDMRDVDAVRAILSRHSLRDHPRPGFRRGEWRKAGLAAKAGGSPGEDHGAAAERNEPPRRLAADKKSAEAANPPELLEQLGRDFTEIDPPIVA